MSFGGLTDLEKSFADFHPTRQRYGVIFVISDFFGRDVTTAREAVKRAASWPGEVHFLQILHPDERSPNLEGEVELSEVETGERRRFWLTKRDVQRYTDAFDAFCDELSRECASHRIDFMQCGADEAFEQRFLDLLNRGSALGGA